MKKYQPYQNHSAALISILLAGLISACHPHDKKPLSDIEWMRAQGRTEAQRINPQAPAEVVKTGIIANLLEFQAGPAQDFIDVRNLQNIEIKGDYLNAESNELTSIDMLTIQLKIKTENQDGSALGLEVLPIQFSEAGNAGTAEHIHRATLVRQVSEGVYIFGLTLNLKYLRDKIAAQTRPITNASGAAANGFIRNFGLRFLVVQESAKTSQIFTRNIVLVDQAEHRTPAAPVNQPAPPAVQ